jgi:hypothetical protein
MRHFFRHKFRRRKLPYKSRWDASRTQKFEGGTGSRSRMYRLGIHNPRLRWIIILGDSILVFNDQHPWLTFNSKTNLGFAFHYHSAYSHDQVLQLLTKQKGCAKCTSTLTPNDLTPSDKFNNTDTLGILVLINPPKQLTTTGTLTFSAPDQTPKNLNINAPANRTTTLPAKYDLTGTPPGIYTLTINLNRPAGFKDPQTPAPSIQLKAIQDPPDEERQRRRLGRAAFA